VGGDDEAIAPAVADDGVVAAVAVDDVEVTVAGDGVVGRAADDVLDAGDAAGAGGDAGLQVDRDAGRVQRVVERVGAGAAVDGAVNALGVAELEGVAAAAAGEVPEVAEGDAADGARVGAGDLPERVGVGADERVRAAAAVERRRDGRQVGEGRLVVAGAEG